MILYGLLLYCALAADPGRCVFDAALSSPEPVGGRWRIESIADEKVLVLDVIPDPYAALNDYRTPIAWENSDAAALPLLAIEFFDGTPGLIQLQLCTADGNCIVPKRQSNYTVLNTRTWRTAWFAFSPETLDAHKGKTVELRLSGARQIRRISLLPEACEDAWQAKDMEIPTDISPAVQLQRPMQLVTTSGMDVHGGMDTLDRSLELTRELAPLARALGFTSIECYVTWKRLEPRRKGEFDFTFYDALAREVQRFGLKLFPLLVVGSEYALPDWFLEGPDDQGMVCLEHGLSNHIQSICYPPHREHVQRVLNAFGRHYEPMNVLEGVRLGPSGNYGESQYPAAGNWGARGRTMHLHIGWWAGDAYAVQNYQQFLENRYVAIEKLNQAWVTRHPGFKHIRPRLPQQMLVPQERLDFTQWYTDLMSEWCAWWARVAREAMPNTPIYQSAGGWGFREAGTDFSRQAKDMLPVRGGIRLTNEVDSFEQNILVTRLATTAARHYGVATGYEPASGHTARGIAGRIFNTLENNGDHLFTYHGNLFSNPYAIDQWLRYLPLLDHRAFPNVEVALFYPETFSQLDDSAFRHLFATGFGHRALELRRILNVDYLDENLVRDGVLDRYKALVFVWGNITDADVLEKIDAWLQNGGIVIYPSFPRGPLSDTAGNNAIFNRWASGNTGTGHFHRFQGDVEPPAEYARYMRTILLQHAEKFSPQTRQLLQRDLPSMVYVAALQSGKYVFLNYNDNEVRLDLSQGTLAVPRFGIALADAL